MTIRHGSKPWKVGLTLSAAGQARSVGRLALPDPPSPSGGDGLACRVERDARYAENGTTQGIPGPLPSVFVLILSDCVRT